MLENLTKENWATFLNQAFQISADGVEPRDMKLIEVSAFERRENGRREPYSLVFQEAGQTVLPQRIYRVQNDVMGEWDLFLVPIGRDADGVRYEAVFN